MNIERNMNNKDDDKWLKDLRERMEDYSEPLPEGLWEELEDELNRPKVVPFWKRWPSVAAAVALILVINSLTLSHWFAPFGEEEDIQLADQLVGAAPASVGTTPTSDKYIAMAAETAEKSSSYTRFLGAVETDVTENSSLNDADTATTSTYPRYTASTRARTTADAGYAMHRKSSHHRSDFEVGVHTGGIPYNSSKQFDGMRRMASYHLLTSNVPIVMGNVNSKLTPYNHVLFSNRHKETTTDVKHRMPINVVGSVKWHFVENWALESGISYTFLQSDLHSGSNLYWEDTQKLHYVGIPIKIHRNIWHNSTVSFYASAGGMIEKCIKGSLESIYVTENNRKEVEKHTVNEHPIQLSMAAAVGAQVNLLRHLGLFVEPGVAYYFDDNSQLETIRKEHPFNFNLQFGLRFSFF